jgi:hypothetical protein
MRRLAIEDFCDRLAFIGCQGGNIDQRRILSFAVAAITAPA